MKLRLLIGALTLSSFLCAQQPQRNIWYFGDKAGIDFTSGTAVALTDGQMQSFEGSSTICDSTGNLLFYTNGGPFVNQDFEGGVWNKEHELMPNGSLNTMNSCNSAAQAALIVPNPKNQYKYYIFTTDCQENNMAGGLRFNEVDMTLDEGLGDVTVSDSLILPKVTESLAGIMHSNNKDYWLVVADYTTDSFHSLLITKDGINDSIITPAGFNFNQSAGQLCPNRAGTKIGFASTNDTHMLDFDPSSGLISNILDMGPPSFGCAFSENDQVFYTSYVSVQATDIRQYDMTATDIPGSRIDIPSTSWLGNMLLGEDGKIYIAKKDQQSIPVINDPNIIGLGCNYEQQGFDLGGQMSLVGLSNFVNEFIAEWCDVYDTLIVNSVGSYTSPSGNYVWTESGMYADTLPTVDGCDSLLTINLIIGPSSIHNNSKLQFKMYPNPFDKMVVFEFDPHEIGSILLYNILGDKIHQVFIGGRERTEIDFSFLDQGIYIVRFQSLKTGQIENLTLKMIKQ